jgi:excisionase family DNA binding protein
MSIPSASVVIPSPSDTLTTREVATQLGLAVRSVQLMVDRGDLQAWKTSGGHRRISRESVMLWLSKTSGTGTAPIQRGASTQPSDLRPGPVRRRSTDSHKPTAVLIEDSAHFQGLIRLMLQQTHPDVSLNVASDAIVGLALCGAVRPDVLIVDLLLPGIDGATLIGSLRSQRLFDGMQVMVVTSLGADQRAPYAFALDGIPVVEKHSLAQDLPRVLTGQLAKTRGRST